MRYSGLLEFIIKPIIIQNQNIKRLINLFLYLLLIIIISRKLMESEPIESAQLTSEILNQLLGLLSDDKLQVRYGTLNAILQYTKSTQSKLLFKGTSFFAQVLNMIREEQLTKIILSNLINLSSCEQLQQQFPRFIQTIVFSLKEWKDLRQELSLLFLLNISKFQSVINKLVNENEKRGFFLQVLYGYIQLKPTRRWVITNIFVNVSSIERGRKYVCQEKIYGRFLKYVNFQNLATRQGVLKVVRNCAFQWQNQQFITQILKKEYQVVDVLAEHLAIIVISGSLCSVQDIETAKKIAQKYSNIQNLNKILAQIKVGPKQKCFQQIELCIDIILVLSNSNFGQRKPFIQQQLLRDVIGLLKFTQLEESYKDKLQALQIFCFF